MIKYKKGCMFAAAKKGSSLKVIVLKNIRLIILEKGVKIFF